MAMAYDVDLGPFTMGGSHPHVLIAGPCVIESDDLARETARGIARITSALGIPYVFKSSYDKANRSSITSFRGPGLKAGLATLAAIKTELNIPILTDVHAVEEVGPVSEVADILQIPAFLCRQTDLLVAAARSGRIVNIKKGQFLAPGDMAAVVDKLEASGTRRIVLTERGTSFGYNNLVVDFRALPIMRQLGYPVVFDATHSVQLPGGAKTHSGGDRRFVGPLARAAAAAGCDGFFMEVHPQPDQALSDGPNMVPLADLEALLQQVLAIVRVAGKGEGKPT